MLYIKADIVCEDSDKLNFQRLSQKDLFSILKSIKDLQEVQKNTLNEYFHNAVKDSTFGISPLALK